MTPHRGCTYHFPHNWWSSNEYVSHTHQSEEYARQSVAWHALLVRVDFRDLSL